jgi:DNA helicase-2/ATP-dependent DNA helicase PcrA
MRDRPGALTLEAAQLGGVDPALNDFPDDAAEARGIAAAIQAEIQSGTLPENIAVLYRINVQSLALEQSLNDLGISTLVHGATRFYELPEVKQAIMALRGASVSVGGEPLFKSVSDVLRSVGWSQEAPAGTGAIRAKWEALNALMVMADDAPEGTSFRAFTDELLARQAAKHEPTMHAVTLASVHSAKGLEWDSVYVIGLSEGLFPISYAQTLDAVAEERRLLYVAITRARKRLALSWAQQATGRQTQRERSRFVSEIGMRIPGVQKGSR